MSKRVTALLAIVSLIAACVAIAYFGSSTIYPADMATAEGLLMTIVAFAALGLLIAAAMLAIMLFG